MDSPVRADWLTKKSLAEMSRRSAGMMDPAVSTTISPGTSSFIGISISLPSRRTDAGGLDHRLQLLHGFARTGFLKIAQEHAQDDHDAHHDGGAQIAHGVGHERNDEELDDERIFAALEDFADEAEFFSLGDFVEAVLGAAFQNLLRR